MTWVRQYERYEGAYQEVGVLVELTVKEALDQDLLRQITEHNGRCSDQNPGQPNGRTGDDRIANIDGYAYCPRCFLLRARDERVSGYYLNSKLKLRVIAQIKEFTAFDSIRWD